MSTSGTPPSRPGPRRAARVPVAGALVTWTSFEVPGGNLPVAMPSLPTVDLVTWAGANRDDIEQRIRRAGAALLRGFPVTTARFEQLMRSLYGGTTSYDYRSTPRQQVTEGVYTSTEYPADQTISLHNEMSYARRSPRWLAFYCEQPATRGGATVIADGTRVHARVPIEVREQFAQRGVQYVRNFGTGLDLRWQDVFQTDDRASVDAFCADNDVEAVWQGDGRLTTREVRPAVVRHPATGAVAWHNQAHLFHPSALDKATREALASALVEDERPRDARYGDGGEIPERDLAAVRAAYEAEAVEVKWSPGDVLLLDNVWWAHGRRPYEGSRRLYVAMAAPWSPGADDDEPVVGGTS